MMGFDFSELDEKKEKKIEPATRTPTTKSITKKEILKMIEALENKIMDRIKIENHEIIKNNNKQMIAYHDALQRELGIFKESAFELWSMIYPTIVKMWGNRRGIGKIAAKLNILLEEKKDTYQKE